MVVDLDGLTAKAPKGWVDKGTTGGMVPRLYNFQLPAVTGDSGPAELYIIGGSGGTLEKNLERWKGAFDPLKDDKVSQTKVAGHEATLIELSGDFKGGRGGAQPIKGARQVTVELKGPRRVYATSFSAAPSHRRASPQGLRRLAQGFK